MAESLFSREPVLKACKAPDDWSISLPPAVMMAAACRPILNAARLVGSSGGWISTATQESTSRNSPTGSVSSYVFVGCSLVTVTNGAHSATQRNPPVCRKRTLHQRQYRCASPQALVPERVAHTVSQLRRLFMLSALPMVGFGFMDNVLMLLAGDFIDTHLGSVLHISTLAAAGLGNLFSDLAGLTFGGTIEGVAADAVAPSAVCISRSTRRCCDETWLGITGTVCTAAQNEVCAHCAHPRHLHWYHQYDLVVAVACWRSVPQTDPWSQLAVSLGWSHFCLWTLAGKRCGRCGRDGMGGIV